MLLYPKMGTFAKNGTSGVRVKKIKTALTPAPELSNLPTFDLWSWTCPPKRVNHHFANFATKYALTPFFYTFSRKMIHDGHFGQYYNWQVPNGQVPIGQVLNWQVPDGQVPDGQVPDGQVPNGQVTMGRFPTGRYLMGR